MTKTKMLADLKSELEMQRESYKIVIAQAIRLLEEAAQRGTASTHLGHNLSARAAELSVIAGKVDSAQAMISYVESQAE